MKISQIKISNLFSFPHISHFSAKQWVVFDAKESSNFNVLIWPNWSGKTNFLNIINQLFRVGLIKEFVYDKEILESWKTNKLENVITQQEVKTKDLFKHFSSLKNSSKISVSLKLNQYDFENIGFVCKYNKLLNSIVKKYSTLDLEFKYYNIYDFIFENEIKLDFLVDVENGKIAISNYDDLSDRMKFVFFYIQHMELIQICINIYNDFMRKSGDKKLYPLKNTFALLESERNLIDFDKVLPDLIVDSITKRSDNIEMYNKGKFSSVMVWYDLFIIKLIKIVKEKLSARNQHYLTASLHEKTSIIKNSSFFLEISSYIERLLHLKLNLKINNSDNQIYLVFTNNEWNPISFSKLSSGEKSIVMMLFSLFGYDLSNGLFIIDEPELHLHPYMLRNLVEVLKEIWTKMNMQFICATHSPLLIDEQSINTVYKFSLEKGNTSIVSPGNTIRASESTLIHILKFENVSKIFFINRIIMVEWETDEYFLRFYINYLSKQPWFRWKLDNYEILNINWKWSYIKWSKFLWKFGIKTYFIWDWDNVIENHIIDPHEMHKYTELAKKHYSTNYIKKEKFYVKIITTIKEVFPKKYNYILKQIESFYNKWIFILTRWDLETYLWLKKKWLEETINFCNKYFSYWLRNKELEPHRKEFLYIIKNIFEI